MNKSSKARGTLEQQASIAQYASVNGNRAMRNFSMELGMEIKDTHQNVLALEMIQIICLYGIETIINLGKVSTHFVTCPGPPTVREFQHSGHT